MAEETGYKSEVHLYHERKDLVSGMVIEKETIILKGQESTSQLLEMAQKDLVQRDCIKKEAKQ